MFQAKKELIKKIRLIAKLKLVGFVILMVAALECYRSGFTQDITVVPYHPLVLIIVGLTTLTFAWFEQHKVSS